MATRTIRDKDGSKFHMVAPHTNELDQMEMSLRRVAAAVGCKIREIPMLGSKDKGPFHPCFLVTRDEDGVIVKREVLEARG